MRVSSAARSILRYLKVAIGQLNGIFSIAATTAVTAPATTSTSFAQAFVRNGSQLSESLLNDGIGSSAALIVRWRSFVRSKDFDGRKAGHAELLSQ